MKNAKFLAVLLGLLALVSCGPKTRVEATIDDASKGNVAIWKLNVNNLTLVDTVKTDAAGRFHYNVPVTEGQPEFVYLSYGGRQLAELLLEAGDRVSVHTDTLGSFCEISGSEESVKLQQVNADFAAFRKRFDDLAAAGENNAAAQEYVKHYRACVKYVMENPGSMTVIPVLYQKLDASTPIFSQPTDALHFRNAYDALVEVYPESRFVKALKKETESREQNLALAGRIDGAAEAGFPDLSVNDINGRRALLSEVKAPVVLVCFWNAVDAEGKMFNTEVLLPLYEEMHPRGLEIYSVGINANKADWATTVNGQKLPWINVNDGLGTASMNLATYNVDAVPAVFLIADGDLKGRIADVSTADAIRREVRKYLK